MTGLEELIDLRGHDEVRLGQSIHRVRPERDLDLAPSQQDVGMMALLLGESANSIHESESGLKIGELEGAHDVMLVDDVPLRRLRQLTMKIRKFFTLQRRNAAVAGDAFLVCEHSCLKTGVLAGRARTRVRIRASLYPCRKSLKSEAPLGAAG